MPNELHTAAADAENGYFKVKRLVEDEGIDVNAPHTQYKTTGVEFAAQSGSLATLKYFVEVAGWVFSVSSLFTSANWPVTTAASDGSTTIIIKRAQPAAILKLGAEVDLHFQSLLSRYDLVPSKSIQALIDAAAVDDFQPILSKRKLDDESTENDFSSGDKVEKKVAKREVNYPIKLSDAPQTLFAFSDVPQHDTAETRLSRNEGQIESPTFT